MTATQIVVVHTLMILVIDAVFLYLLIKLQ